MEKTYKPLLNMWSLSCDKSHVLHDKRKAEVTEIRRTTVKASDLEYWEELPASALTPYTEAEYKAKVVELVRERYDEGDEFGIQRKMINTLAAPMTLSYETAERAATEYAEYNNYVEECKQRAKEMLSQRQQ